MKKDKFLKEFQKINFDEITVYLKDLGNGKIKYSLIFTYDGGMKIIKKISSKEFLKEFMDNICYKLKDEEIIQSRNSVIEDDLNFYEVKTKNNNIVLLLSEIGLDNEFFNETIEYTSNKKSGYIIEKFNELLENDEVKKLYIKESPEESLYDSDENKFLYLLSSKDIRRREVENICNMLASFVNKYRGEISDVKRSYLTDTNECFRVEITLGKNILTFDSYNSRSEKTEDIREIVITGKELINALEPKIEEIENVINKNKKLIMECE